MAIELRILVYAALLLMVHIFAEIRVKTVQYGRDWNMSARDQDLPEPNKIAARLGRAKKNYMETLPIAVIALLGVVVADKADWWTGFGGWLWLGARTVYLPIYWAGIPVIRTLVYGVSLIGLGIVLWPLLTAG